MNGELSKRIQTVQPFRHRSCSLPSIMFIAAALTALPVSYDVGKGKVDRLQGLRRRRW
jgi:hypothetical protein